MKDYKKLFHGCVRVEQTEKGYIPLRFSDARLAVYDSYPNKPYSRFPASVYMEFETDAEQISFHFSSEKVYYVPIMFDIYENGYLRETVTQALGMFEGDIQYQRKASGKSTIRIYLPAAAMVYLSDFCIGDWNPTAPGEKKMLVLGDSICQGLFGKHPSLGVVPQLGRMLGYEYLNLSVGGENYSADALDDFGFQPDLILVALGTNDYSYQVPREEVEVNARAYFKRLKEIYPGVPVIVITPPWIHDLRTQTEELKRFLAHRSTMECCAKEANLPVADGFNMIPNMAEFFEDCAHPNDLGFQQYASNLLKFIQRNI